MAMGIRHGGRSGSAGDGDGSISCAGREVKVYMGDVKGEDAGAVDRSGVGRCAHCVIG